ncbi:MAG: uracil-DNA glycosylase family protein [Pyrinomonadaceae bacterium]|nr:uracil-DNA glycosylase family protein [Pyrinomonadaceae bacterium]
MKIKALPLANEIKGCTVCKEFLPFPPKPIFSFSENSKIVLIGQAPGIKVQESGTPWDDASGVRLREWLEVSDDQFYDPDIFAIVPMGFCYPGKGKSGDNPPRPECAPLWMDRILETLPGHKLKILIGQYAQKRFLGDSMKKNLTETVKSWPEYLPDLVVLPHPSPRNNIWLKKNPWFRKELLPNLRKVVNRALN